MSVIYIRLSEALKRKVSDLLRDPATGDVKYGAFNALCTKLLEKWVEKKEKDRPDERSDR